MQAAVWTMELSGCGLFSMPHMLQRVYAAKDIRSLKLAWTVMAFGSWVMHTTGVIFGIVAVEWLGPSVTRPFGPMLELVMASSWCALTQLPSRRAAVHCSRTPRAHMSAARLFSSPASPPPAPSTYSPPPP